MRLLESLDPEIDYNYIFKGILDDFFGIASEYKVIGIINLNDLSSISRCHRDLRLCFGTDLHVTSKLETNFTSNQCRRQFLADCKHVALLKSPDKQSFLSCVDVFPKFILKQEVWTRYIEQCAN